MISARFRCSLFVIALALGVAWGAPARACKCRPLSVAEAGSEATTIFEGRVTKIADEAQVEGGPPAGKLVTLSLVRTWKGLENEETITLHTSESSASCGYPFELDKSYLLYAQGALDALTVSTCSRTRPMAEANEDLAALGAGVTPVKVEAIKDAGAPPAAKPKPAGCASTRGQASASLWWMGLPVLALSARRRH